jgi:hypothetical protein
MYRELVEVTFSVANQFGCNFTILVISGYAGLSSVHGDPLCYHVQQPNEENMAA